MVAAPRPGGSGRPHAALAFTRPWAFALARTGAGRLGERAISSRRSPFLLGWELLGEVPPGLAIVGGVACIGGVVIARSSGWPAFLQRIATA